MLAAANIEVGCGAIVVPAPICSGGVQNGGELYVVGPVGAVPLVAVF